MDYPVISFIKTAIKTISADGLFLVSLGGVAVLFAAFYVSVLSKKNQSGFAFTYFSFTAAAFITLICAIYLIAEPPFHVFAFYFAVPTAETVIFSLLIKAASEKKDDRSEEKELIKYIDGEIDKGGVIPEKKGASTSGTIKCEPVSAPKISDELNFSHVKSVLDRLEYFDLSPTDKKQVEALKDAMFSAERQGFTPEKKSRINDGLANLLKIMSKYGV